MKIGLYSELARQHIVKIRNEISDAINKIVNTMEEYCKSLNLSFADCILMGFSQGGMMTFEVGNFLKKQLAGLVILSGRIMKNDPIENKILQQTPIFISHGEKDEVIPLESLYKSKEYLSTNKCNFESHILPFDGHNISPEAINLLQNFIKKIL